MKIRTMDDARCLVEHSGVIDWQWGGKASLEELVQYVFTHGYDVDHDAFQTLLANYLLSVGEYPPDYGLSVKRHGPSGDHSGH